MSDDIDDCEEWVGWVDIPPKRSFPMRGVVRRNLSTPESRAFWADVDAAAKAVRSWPAWKRGEWQEYPSTKPWKPEGEE